MLRREMLRVAVGAALTLASAGCRSATVARDELALGQDPKANARRLRSAIARAVPGTTIPLPSGRYEIELTQQSPFIEVNRSLAIEGATGGTRLVPVSANARYLEVFRVTADRVRLSRLTLSQQGRTPTVLINVARGSDLEISNLTLLGPRVITSGAFCHGIQFGLQNADHDRIRIQDSVFSGLTSSTLVTNTSTSKMSDITVERCRAENLDFNCPNATLNSLSIRNCRLDGAKTTNFGIALAHVGSAEIVGTTITGAAWSGIHIEDHSSSIRVRDCVLKDCARGGTNASGFIHIISGSRAIEIATTRFVTSGRRYTEEVRSVSIQAGGTGRTAGGRPTSPPSIVAIVANSFESQTLGPASVYLEGGTRHRVERNRFSGSRAALGKSDVPVAGLTIAGGADVLVRNNDFIDWDTGISLQATRPQVATRMAEQLRLANRFSMCLTAIGIWQR